LFIEEVETYGVYAALIFAGCNNVSSYGSSNYARNPYNERGSTTDYPIAGGKELVRCENDEDKNRIAIHCNTVIQSIMSVCDELHRRYGVEGRVKKRGILQASIAR
jgi:hypothetical protein